MSAFMDWRPRPVTDADIYTASEINHWRHVLDDIRDMLDQITDTTYTIASQPFDLSGRTHPTEPALPGGDRLDATGPWASDATHAEGCDPTPRQVIVEWAHTIYDAHGQVPPAHLRFTQAWIYNRQQVPWILESPWANTWTSDIRQTHARLQRLCPPLVGTEHDSRQPVEPIHLPSHAHRIPDHSMLTRDAAEHFYPGQLTATDWDRLRKRAQRARADGRDIPHGHYPVEWIREHAGTQATSVCARA